MTKSAGRCPFGSRRGFIAGAGGLAGAVGAGIGRLANAAPSGTNIGVGRAGQDDARTATQPFWGEYQGGILTPTQSHTYFAAFDLTVTQSGEVAALMRRWTEAAARMAEGETAAPLGNDLTVPAGDSGEVLGMSPARLTLTFGFGASLFIKNGRDHLGLSARRPAALVDLPRFNGDQLEDGRTGGDLSVQACADDPQLAFHAVRQLARLAYGAAQIRWVQTGFSGGFAAGETPRNLMGFKDGTQNPITRPPVERANSPRNPKDILWVGNEGSISSRLMWEVGYSPVLPAPRRASISDSVCSRPLSQPIGWPHPAPDRRRMRSAPPACSSRSPRPN
jgi:deferrochelatase/peroxidase EfeB